MCVCVCEAARRREHNGSSRTTESSYCVCVCVFRHTHTHGETTHSVTVLHTAMTRCVRKNLWLYNLPQTITHTHTGTLLVSVPEQEGSALYVLPVLCSDWIKWTGIPENAFSHLKGEERHGLLLIWNTCIFFWSETLIFYILHSSLPCSQPHLFSARQNSNLSLCCQLPQNITSPSEPSCDLLCCCSSPPWKALPFFFFFMSVLLNPTVTTSVTNVDGEQVKFSARANKCHHTATYVW